VSDLIKRFVEPGALPPGVLTDFDAVKNILRIDKQFYDHATSREQTMLWRAKGTIVLDHPTPSARALKPKF
jgi:hypothetical protein